MLPVLLPLALLMPLAAFLPELQHEALLELLIIRPPRTTAAGTEEDASPAACPVEDTSEDGVPTLLSTAVHGNVFMPSSEDGDADGGAVRDALRQARAVLARSSLTGGDLSGSWLPFQLVSGR